MSSPAAFDNFVHNYDEELERGVRLSGESKDYFAENRIRWVAKCLQKLGQRPARVLDFGCGTGSSSVLLQQILGAETYVGVDASQKSVEFAEKAFGSPERYFTTIDRLPADFSFDLAYCNGVFHHIPVPQRRAAVEFVFRRLKPGGIFAMWENNPWNLGTRLVMSRIAFDRNAVCLSVFQASQLLRDAGFSIVHTQFMFIFPRLLRRLRFLEPHLSALPIGAQYQVLCQRGG
jgi:SAM-dependent methyltransferase